MKPPQEERDAHMQPSSRSRAEPSLRSFWQTLNPKPYTLNPKPYIVVLFGVPMRFSELGCFLGEEEKGMTSQEP